MACLQFRNKAPSLASVAEATTERKIKQRVKNAPFSLIGLVASGFHPMKKMTACQTVCIGFGEVRRVGVNVEDHVGGMKMDGGIGMSCKVIKELFAFFIVDLVPLDFLLAIVLRAMSTVRLTARA